MIMTPRLKFRGEEYLLINRDGDREQGAIATEEELIDFRPNRYHLCRNGDIMSFGEVIGNASEIEWLGND